MALVLGRDSCFDLNRIDIESLRIDITKTAWHGMRQIELAVAKEGKGSGDPSTPSPSEGFDAITRASDRSATDGMLDAKVFLHLLFELFNLSPLCIDEWRIPFPNLPDILHQGLVLSS
jgi:hypothetical protein